MVAGECGSSAVRVDMGGDGCPREIRYQEPVDANQGDPSIEFLERALLGHPPEEGSPMC